MEGLDKGELEGEEGLALKGEHVVARTMTENHWRRVHCSNTPLRVLQAHVPHCSFMLLRIILQSLLSPSSQSPPVPIRQHHMHHLQQVLFRQLRPSGLTHANVFAQTQQNKFMYSITMHVICYLNWMSFKQSVRPQSQILSVLLKHGWMTMSQAMTSPYPTTSYFKWTGIDMGVALLYLFIFPFHAKSCYKVDLLHWSSFQLYHSLHFVCAFSIPHHRRLFLFLIIFVLHSRLLIQQIFLVFFLLDDFNVNFGNTDHFLFSHVKDIMLSFSLTQVVFSHTYISPSSTPSLLDLAMLTNPEQLQTCTTIPPLITMGYR